MDSDESKPQQSAGDEGIEARIDRLKEQARALSGGHMASGTAPDCPPRLEEQFWKQVLDFENMPRVQLFDVLTRSGQSLPAPEELDDQQLTEKLWEVINGLAELGVCLEFTDHLNDRELYTRLWTKMLRDPIELDPEHPTGTWHFDFTGDETDDGIDTWLKYYADEDTRRSWARDYPDDPLPEAATPPYDRDRHLP